MRRFFSIVTIGLGMLCAANAQGIEDRGDWKQILVSRLPYYGHRNWIVVADAAYPAQSQEGIETILAGGDQRRVLQRLLALLATSKHVRPNIFLDSELPFVPETDAPGIGEYRTELNAVLANYPKQSVPHEELISRLDAAGRTFKVLIIKTDTTLPYSSVFLQLGAAYWSDEAEMKLRTAMGQR